MLPLKLLFNLYCLRNLFAIASGVLGFIVINLEKKVGPISNYYNDAQTTELLL
jgi:hypothetical protein